MTDDDPITRAYLEAGRINHNTAVRAAAKPVSQSDPGAAGRAEAERRFKTGNKVDPIAAAIFDASTNDHGAADRLLAEYHVRQTRESADIQRDLRRRRNDSHLH